jgi:hypothetical protein
VGEHSRAQVSAAERETAGMHKSVKGT